MTTSVRGFLNKKGDDPSLNVDRRPASSGFSGLAGDKTSRTLMVLILIALIPYAAPGLRKFRLFQPASGSTLNSSGQGSAGPTGASDPATTLQGAAGQSPTVQNADIKAGEIEDPSGHALDHLFSSLMEAEAGKRQVRITHYGDSPITNDGITSTVRRELQLKFGDAGHGFILIAKPWGWYGHLDVRQDASTGWASDPMFISQGDHMFGLGGVTFSSSSSSARATFGTSDDGPVGHQASSFDIYYLTQPGGGDFDVSVDGNFQTRVKTGNDRNEPGFFQAKAPNGAHTLTLSVAGDGPVRLFGVVLQSDSPGVQYDSIGVNGAYVGLLAHYMDPDHWTSELKHRDPDLVILNYGTNESQFDRLPMDQYERDTKEVIRRIRAALPQASIMLVAPMDRGMRGEGGTIITRPMIPRLVSRQRQIAADTGCAFFDTYTAMGGEGTAAKWLDARPKLMGGDYTHPTFQGSEIVGHLISKAILGAYERFKDQHSEVLAGDEKSANAAPQPRPMTTNIREVEKEKKLQ